MIDIDVDEKKGVNGYESTTDLGDLSLVTLAQNTPRGRTPRALQVRWDTSNE